jgi:hypothetical protein
MGRDYPVPQWKFWEGRPVESGNDIRRLEVARSCALRRRAFFVREGEQGMPNHLTPEELSKELGIDRQEVIRVCLEEGVPIYQGKIDKTLFAAQLEAIGAMPQHH